MNLGRIVKHPRSRSTARRRRENESRKRLKEIERNMNDTCAQAGWDEEEPTASLRETDGLLSQNPFELITFMDFQFDFRSLLDLKKS